MSPESHGRLLQISHRRGQSRGRGTYLRNYSSQVCWPGKSQSWRRNNRHLRSVLCASDRESSHPEMSVELDRLAVISEYLHEPARRGSLHGSMLKPASVLRGDTSPPAHAKLANTHSGRCKVIRLTLECSSAMGTDSSSVNLICLLCQGIRSDWRSLKSARCSSYTSRDSCDLLALHPDRLNLD